MLSPETRYLLLLLGLSLTFVLIADDRGTGSWWEVPVTLAVLFPSVWALLYFGFAVKNTALSNELNRLLASRSARSLDVRLRKGFLAPTIDVPIPNVGMARVRFFTDPASAWMRLRLKTEALSRAPWLHLQGASRFWSPTALVGARALSTPTPDRHWRYWRLPWRPAEPVVEDPDFCAALPATQQTLVLTSRPGHLLIRLDCAGDRLDFASDEEALDGVLFGPYVAFENMVNLAIAWVKAVQQTAGAPAAERAPGA